MTQRQRRPLSPEAAAVVQAMSGGRFSRRSLMAGAGALGAGAFLSACGTSGTSTSSSGKPKAAVDKSKTDKVVNWANWALYLDYDDKTKVYPTLDKFQQTTKIKATYAEDIEDNDSYFAKIQAQLKTGQDFGKDIVVFTDWMMARCIRLGYAQKFDKATMPNVTANLLPKFRDPDYDPGRGYSVTWQSGYAGIAYSVDGFKQLGLAAPTKVSDLWNPKLKGRIEVLSEMRDTIGLIMMDQGVDITKFTTAQFKAALDVLKEQLSNGQIRQVKGQSYSQDLTSGDALASFAWSGDVVQIQAQDKYAGKFEFKIPDSGGTLWADNMWIPIGSPHKENAEILMNFYYDPKIAAEVATYVNYICPVAGAEKYVDKTLATNNLIFPTDDYLKQVHVFRSLSPAEETDFNSKYQSVLGV